MKKAKKMISIFLSVVMVLSCSLTTYATEITPSTENQDVLLNTKYFQRDGNGQMVEIGKDGIQLFGTAYNFGDIRIDDVLSASSGITTASEKTLIGEAAKNTILTVIPAVPGVGNVVSTAADIIGLLKSYGGVVFNVDYSKQYTVRTQYSYRNFTHKIMAYTTNYAWKEVGSSLSKYWYKHLYTRAYNKSSGDYITAAYDFTHSKGWSPAAISKAPNYMNYSALSKYGYEAYTYNRTYRETY